MLKLKKIKVMNYKSIVDSGEINFEKKLTVLAGKNNAGKTALIEALCSVFEKKLGAREIGRFEPNFILTMTIIFNNASSVLHQIFGMKCSDELELEFTMKNGYLVYSIEDLQSGAKCTPILNNDSIWVNLDNCPNSSAFAVESEFYFSYFLELAQYLIFISASRNVPSFESISEISKLDKNAVQLNTFILSLHNNKEAIFNKIESDFIKVFPEVIDIKTNIFGINQTKLELVFEGSSNPIALSDCGSGYTQVLILLSVLHSVEDRIILYDEPQSYLHPSAEKAIYDLCSEHPEHQLVFTTHSPILINYPIDKSLYLVKKVKGASTYKSLDKFGEVLEHIGVVNSDFSFADKIIFVEGETEELILPLILRTFGIKQIGFNYKILNMKGTDKEFSKKGAMNNNAAKLKLILGGLSNDAPIPYLIVIDRDEKNDEQIAALYSAYNDHICILTRREIENYFLDCYEELAELMNQTEPEHHITKEKVEHDIKRIMSNTEDRALYPKSRENLIRDVKGSMVMEYFFKEYNLLYSKVNHGKIITSLIIKKSPEKLKEVADLVSPFLLK
ncbi:hypothetical protein BJP49_01200 [Paenibacillus odorifer]|nr:hypothetical protein BJP49_01200 [Paenibacillus odorifer]